MSDEKSVSSLQRADVTTALGGNETRGHDDVTNYPWDLSTKNIFQRNSVRPDQAVQVPIYPAFNVGPVGGTVTVEKPRFEPKDYRGKGVLLKRSSYSLNDQRLWISSLLPQTVAGTHNKNGLSKLTPVPFDILPNIEPSQAATGFTGFSIQPNQGLDGSNSFENHAYQSKHAPIPDSDTKASGLACAARGKEEADTGTPITTTVKSQASIGPRQSAMDSCLYSDQSYAEFRNQMQASSNFIKHQQSATNKMMPSGHPAATNKMMPSGHPDTNGLTCDMNNSQAYLKIEDEELRRKRMKNNLAAKRSRDARRKREEERAIRVAYLEKENARLRGEISVLRCELANLQGMVYTGDKQSNM